VSNRRPIVVLLLGIVVLILAHVVLQSVDGGRRMEKRRTLFERTESVGTVRIERRGNAALELRWDEEGSTWCITKPFSGRADAQTVARLLDILLLTPIVDTVSDDELVRLGRTHADFSLVEPPVRVSLESENATESVSFGTLTPSADGVYAVVDGVGAVYVVPTNVLAAVDRPTEDFRRRTLFAVAPESVTSFTVRQDKGQTLVFTRESDGWKVDGELASKSHVEGFLADVLSAEILDFVWPVGASNETERISASLLAGYGLEPENAVVVTLKGVDNKDRQLSFGRAAADGRVYASVQNGTSVVTLKESLKAAALQTKSVFADFRLFPVSESAVARIRLAEGNDTYVLARSDNGAWRLEVPVAAPANPEAVRRLLLRVLALPNSAGQDAPPGFSVALSAEAKPIGVARERVLEKDRLDDLRSVEMVRIDPKEVKRLVCTTGEKHPRTVSFVRNREGGTWMPESADEHASADADVIAEVLQTLDPLVARRVEKLKVTAADLDGYGLGVPFLTVAVDLDRENAVRRNVLIGAKTWGGRYATIGSADAVFVISNETVKRLSEAVDQR